MPSYFLREVQEKADRVADRARLIYKQQAALNAARTLMERSGLVRTDRQLRPPATTGLRPPYDWRQIDSYHAIELPIGVTTTHGRVILPPGVIHFEEEKWFGDHSPSGLNRLRLPNAPDKLSDGCIRICHPEWGPTSAQTPVINTVHLDTSSPRFTDDFLIAVGGVAEHLEVPLNLS